MSSSNDELIWVTSLPERAAMVGVNLILNAKNWNLDKPPCLVFDVDETLILNNPNADDSFKCQKVGKTLFDYAAQEKIPIYLITARAKSQWSKNYLLEQLRIAGYNVSHIKKLFMQPKSFLEHKDGGATFKKLVREKLGATHTIVINSGDRWGDVLSNYNTEENISNQVPQTKNTYVGVKPAEPYILYGLKFPDEVIQ